MHINVIFDTVCPWCFIGKHRLAQALKDDPRESVEISWQPFLLNPEMPFEGMDWRHYLAAKFGGELRAERVYAAITEAGRQSGIEFDFKGIQRIPSSIDSHRLIRYAERDGLAEDAVEQIFKEYFLLGQDIGNRSVLIRVAEDLNLDIDGFQDYLYGDEDIDEIREQNARAHRFGISGVPAFVVDGQFTISGAQEPAILQRIFDVAGERRQEILETGIQPV